MTSDVPVPTNRDRLMRLSQPTNSTPPLKRVKLSTEEIPPCLRCKILKKKAGKTHLNIMIKLTAPSATPLNSVLTVHNRTATMEMTIGKSWVASEGPYRSCLPFSVLV